MLKIVRQKRIHLIKCILDKYINQRARSLDCSPNKNYFLKLRISLNLKNMYTTIVHIETKQKIDKDRCFYTDI